jgi:hypothetical protein
LAPEGPETPLVADVVHVVHKLAQQVVGRGQGARGVEADCLPRAGDVRFPYADDDVICVEVELCTVREILALFGEAYGLRTNYAKCLMSPIASLDEEALEAAGVMECQLAPFPVKYFGISLTVDRLPA